MPHRLRLGIIGCGIFVQKTHLPTLRELGDYFEVAALCSRTPESAAAAAALVDGDPWRTTDHHALLARGDIDAIDVVVPIHLTYGIVRDCLAAGKPVFSEKPIAETVAQANDLRGLAERNRLPYLIAENFRYQDRFPAMRRLLDAGRIGEPKLFELHAVRQLDPAGPYAASAWRRASTHRGGWLLDGGVHIIAGLHQLAPEPVREVQAWHTAAAPQLVGGQPDTLISNLRIGATALGQLTMSYGIISRGSYYTHIYGTEGTLSLLQRREVNGSAPRYTDWIELRRSEDDPHPEVVELVDSKGGFRQEFLDFYRHVREGMTPVSTPAQATRDLQVISALVHAAQSGTIVPVPEALSAPWEPALPTQRG